MADIPVRVPIRGGTFVTPQSQPAFQGQPSFTQKKIELTISLQPNQATQQPVSFAGTQSNTVTLSGFRTSVRIGNYGAAGGSNADVRVYGLHESMMDQLSALGMVFNLIAKNSIVISAGDDRGLVPVFGGTIFTALPDYNAAPNVPFIMQCQSGYFSGITPAPASSFPQSTDVATIMSGFANTLGIGFENNGVTIQLPPSYFPGDVRTQIAKCAEAAHIRAEIVDAGKTLAIWPIGGSRTSQNGQGIPLISKDTGIFNYPTLSPNGYLTVQTLFNPKLSFGNQVQIKSTKVPLANGTWVVNGIDVELDSLVPKGQWRSTLRCYPVGYSAPPPPNGGT